MSSQIVKIGIYSTIKVNHTMKTLVFTFILIFLFIPYNFSQDSLSNKLTDYQALSIHFSYPITTSTQVKNLQAIDRGFDFLIDNRLKWVKIRTGKHRFLKGATRFLRYALIDRPISANVQLTNHEVFGHMASGLNNNYRITGYYQPVFYYKLKLFNLTYNIKDLNIPNDFFSAFVIRTEKNEFNYSRTQNIMVQSSGLMAENTIRNEYQENWQQNESIKYSDATTYLQTMFDNYNYIRQASYDYYGDMGSYLMEVNLNYFQNNTFNNDTDLDTLKNYALNNFKIKLDDFRRGNYISTFSDPNAYFSLLAIGNYIIRGKSITKLPLLKLGKVRFMPVLSMVLSPFGLEYNLRTPLITPKYNMHVQLRYGQAYSVKYYGIGIQLFNYVISKSLIVHSHLELFAQPSFYFGNRKDDEEEYRKIGGNGFLATFEFQKIFSSKIPTFLQGRLGYKSAGFVLGEGLRACPIIEFGYGILLKKNN